MCEHENLKGVEFMNDEGDWLDRYCPDCGTRIIYNIVEVEED